MSNADSTRHLRGIAGIRKRPAMYIGGTDFFGFVHYVVSAFDLMLEHGATFVEIKFDYTIRLSSDARISISLDENGDILPFEAFGSLQTRRQHSPDAAILAALSETFQLSSSDGIVETTLGYAEGQRCNFQQNEAASTEPSFQLDFFRTREFSLSRRFHPSLYTVIAAAFRVFIPESRFELGPELT